MFSYKESSVALLTEMMSIMGIHSINALIDRVNEANADQGLRKLTWMTVNNHTSGSRVFNRSSVDKISRAMRRLDDPQRRQLIDLADRLTDATDVERSVIKGRGVIGGQSLNAKQIVLVKTLHAKAVRRWRQSINRAYGVTKNDIVYYLKNQRYSSISCLIKIMSHLQTRNLNRLTELINARLPEGMFLGGAILYTHMVDARRLLSEGGIRILEVALMNDKSDRVLCSLARRFIKACAVEKFAVLYEHRLGVAARKIIGTRTRDIDNWHNISKGVEFNDEQLSAYLEKSDSSLTIINNILAILNVVSLNKLTDVINDSLPEGVRRINGGALYSHFNELDRLIPDNGVQAILTALQGADEPQGEQLQKLANSLVESIEIERYALGLGKPTDLTKKIIDRRKRDIKANTSRPDPRSYRRTSHGICDEIMKVFATKRVEDFVASVNEGIEKINASGTANHLTRLSPGIIYKHLKGYSVLSDSSLNKIAVAMTVQPASRRSKLLGLAKQLTSACRVERAVINSLVEDTDANRKSVAKVKRLRTASINRYHQERQRLHTKRN